MVNDILYFHVDQLESIRLITRSDGTVYKHNNYLPFGKVLAGLTNGPTILPLYAESKMAFTGQEFDTSTGLHYFKARFYDPEIATFIQPDEIIANPRDTQAFNHYNYCRNNPFRFTDPTGNFIIEAIIVAYILTVAITVAVVNAFICAISVLAAGGSITQALEAGLVGFGVGFVMGVLGAVGFLSPAQVIQGMAGSAIGAYSAGGFSYYSSHSEALTGLSYLKEGDEALFLAEYLSFNSTAM